LGSEAPASQINRQTLCAQYRTATPKPLHVSILKPHKGNIFAAGKTTSIKPEYAMILKQILKQ